MAKQAIQALADAAADRYGVPRDLYRRLIRQESGWNPDAHNPSGATGLVQIHLPSHPDVTEAQARNPAFAADWGARYLKAQYDQFGNWRSALAAYNAGPGNVTSGKWKSFPETRNYVKTILGGGVATPAAAPSPILAPIPAQSATEPLGLSPLVAGILDRNAAMIGVPSIAPLLAKFAAAPPLAAPAAPMPSSPVSAPVPQDLPSSSSATGFQPAFKTALDRMIADSNGKVWVTSGYRSPERQAVLFAAAVKKYGSEAAARKWVAPPDKSRHGKGDAADLGGDLNWVRANAAKYGLYQPMSWEDWHYELRGSRG